MPRSSAHTTCGYALRGLAERAALRHDREATVARLGVRGEAVRGERVGDRGERGLHRPVALGGVHARGERRAVLEADLVGERLGLRGPERVERACEQAAEQVVVLERERERRVERTGEVALRRATGGARRAVDRGLGDLDDEVAAAGELLEVVAGDVGVQLELLGHLAPAVTPAAPASRAKR